MTRDTTGAITIEAVPSSEVTKREKACTEDYIQAYKAYKEAKKDNPSEPKPKKATIVVLEKLVRGKDKAESAALKYRDKYEAAQAKKAEKESREAETEPAAGKEEAGKEDKEEKKES